MKLITNNDYQKILKMRQVLQDDINMNYEYNSNSSRNTYMELLEFLIHTNTNSKPLDDINAVFPEDISKLIGMEYTQELTDLFESYKKFLYDKSKVMLKG